MFFMVQSPIFCSTHYLYDNVSYLSIVQYDKMSLVMHMKTRLRELRKAKKKTQLTVQIETGIEQALLSKYENGNRIPPTETLILLADYYNVSIDYILCRSDSPRY